jgi:Tfp pilus assembly protein PilN
VLALCGLTVAAARERSQLRRVVKQKRESVADMKEIAVKVEEARAVQTDLERRQQIHRLLGAGKPIHAAILKELSNVLPEGVYLRSLSFARPQGVATMLLGVDIYGGPAARPMELKQKLIAALEDSPYFVNVSFVPTSQDGMRPNRRTSRTTRPPDEALDLTCQVLGFPGGAP